MARITFKGKPETISNVDGSLAYEYIRVPVLDRKHCDMGAFRSHPKYGSYANSDMFKGMLARIRSELVGGSLGLRLDRLPANVTVAPGSFLAVVTVEV